MCKCFIIFLVWLKYQNKTGETNFIFWKGRQKLAGSSFLVVVVEVDLIDWLVSVDARHRGKILLFFINVLVMEMWIDLWMLSVFFVTKKYKCNRNFELCLFCVLKSKIPNVCVLLNIWMCFVLCYLCMRKSYGWIYKLCCIKNTCFLDPCTRLFIIIDGLLFLL